jgi:hypothetical protein
MKALGAVFLLFACGSFGFAQRQNTWDGFVTDTHCGTNCQRTSAMTPDRACVRRCVKQGSKYGLWSGNHVYELEPQSKVSRFAAENIRVTGELSNDTIQIKSVTEYRSQRRSVRTSGRELVRPLPAGVLPAC